MHFAFALFAFWPYITTILINFSHLQAMSSDSDDFDFAALVGLPAVLGGGLGSESGGGVFDFAPAVAGPRAVSDSDSDFDFAVSAPVAQKRRRQRTPAPTLGAFWTVAITKDSETAAPDTHTVFMDWWRCNGSYCEKASVAKPSSAAVFAVPSSTVCVASWP